MPLVERAMSRMDRAREGKKFASEEEANTYLQKVVGGGGEVDRLWDGEWTRLWSFGRIARMPTHFWPGTRLRPEGGAGALPERRGGRESPGPGRLREGRGPLLGHDQEAALHEGRARLARCLGLAGEGEPAQKGCRLDQ